MPAEVRRRAKAINFGIIYGISAFGLANQLGIPREEAGAYIKRYFERFPGIRGYMDAMRAQVKQDGFVSTLFGRKIHFPQAKSSNPAERAFVERASINAPIQGTAADIIRRAMIRMEDALAAKKLSARMLLQVHDELVFEVPEEEVADTMPLVARGHGEGSGTRGSSLGAAPRRRQGRRQLGRRALGSADNHSRVGGTMIRHTVAFRLKHARSSAEEKKFLEAGKKLARIPGVQKFEALNQVSPKNDFTFGFSMEFADQAAYDGYNNHPDHVAFVRDLWVPEVADFLEIDYTPL